MAKVKYKNETICSMRVFFTAVQFLLVNMRMLSYETSTRDIEKRKKQGLGL
jgi:hypothetical protein